MICGKDQKITVSAGYTTYFSYICITNKRHHKPKLVIRPPKVLFPFLREALWASCPLLSASCFPSCLDVAHYAFIKPENNT